MLLPIIRHELRSVLHNSKSWYCLAVIQAALAIIFNWLLQNFLRNQAVAQSAHYGITEEVLHPFYAWFGLLTLLLMPMLVAQTLSGEKQRGTIVNYYCAPITSWQVIMAKFFSINILLLALLAFISIMPLSIVISGALDWGQYAATLLGVILMLTATVAICLSISALLNNVVRANVMMILSIAALIMLEWAAQYAGSSAIFLQGFGLLYPLKNFLAGIITLRGTAYYLCIMLSFLGLASWSYTRKWQN